MSFSGEIREELVGQYAKARHCDLAELSAILHVCGDFSEDRAGICTAKFRTENFPVARKCFTLMKKTFNIVTYIAIRRNPQKGSWSYMLCWKGDELLAIRDVMVQEIGRAHV